MHRLRTKVHDLGTFYIVYVDDFTYYDKDGLLL